MNVILTVDVESYTGDYEREVYARGLGLSFITTTCRRFEASATFFVEALGATQWGYEPVRGICRTLLEDGHDVQLHLHPVVARIPGFTDRDDVLWKRDRATQKMLLEKGVEILGECGVDVTAFRAGDFAANEDTLAAMEELGILISSNRDLDQKSSIRSLLNDSFPVRNDISRRGEMVDVPVTACRSPFPFLDGRYRHMEIAAMGTQETCTALSRMAARGYTCACLLTHPGEFFRWRQGEATVIRKNCDRLEAVLDFVRTREDMSIVTLAECVASGDAAEEQPPEVPLSPVDSLRRVAEQALDRVRVKVGR